MRRCQAEAVPVVIVRRGDEAAGAIFISVDRLDGSVRLYGPAPAGHDDADSDRRWVSCLGSEPVLSVDADRYLKRQLQFDADLWIIEIEDRSGRHFLSDVELES